MNDAAHESRSATRFATSLMGELASGQALVAVRIVELSTKGCTAAITRDHDIQRSMIGPTGILQIMASPDDKPSAILPVRLVTGDPVRDKLFVGLQFLLLTPRQSAKLASLLTTLRIDRSMWGKREIEARLA